MKITVDVLQLDIDRAVLASDIDRLRRIAGESTEPFARRCPVAQALKRRFLEEVTVSLIDLTVGSLRFEAVHQDVMFGITALCEDRWAADCKPARFDIERVA